MRYVAQGHKSDYLNDRLNAQRVLALISLFIPFSLLAIYHLTPHASDAGSAYLLNGISIIVIVTAIIRLFANWKKPRGDVYQLVCAFFDFLGISAILVGYAFIYDVPISVALKSPTANIFFVYLASRVVLLHGPILLKTCGAAVVTWAGLTCLAVSEPQSIGVTSSYVEYLTSFKILVGAEVERLVQFIIITAILYTFIHLIRHDPGTGYLRRPIFLQSIDKFLNDAKRWGSENTQALIEVRIMGLAHSDRLYDAVFAGVSDLSALKSVTLRKVGRLSNRNVALWISYPNGSVELEDLTDRLAGEIARLSVSDLASQVPRIIVGGTLFNYDASSEQQLTFTNIAIRDANLSGSPARVFDEKMRAGIARETYVKQAIRDGLSGNLFSVCYQPIIDLMTNKPAGFEALIRLKTKAGEDIPPDVFIPIAEKTGLIGDITGHLCSAIEKEGPQIRESFTGESGRPYININISPQQLNDIDHTLAGLRRAQAGGLTINVEITESDFLNETTALEKIQRLKQAGFSLAIDDFGTGHSSINRLDKLDVSTLKIDQCFLQNIETEKGYAFLNAIVNLSLTASETVIIEGVETLPQKLLLMKMGVRFCQGYYFAKPMPVGELQNHLSLQYGVRRPPRKRYGHIASL